jgi:hypothetical protein
VNFVKADVSSGPLCAEPSVEGFFENKNPCKLIGITFRIFLPQNIRENYYLLKLYPGKVDDKYEVIPFLPAPLYVDGEYYKGSYIELSNFLSLIKKSDYKELFGNYLEYPHSLTYQGFEKGCIVFDESSGRKIDEELSKKSETEIAKISELEYYKKRLKEMGENFVTCNEFDKKLIKIKFAKPEDSDKNVLEELGKQLGIYNKDEYQKNQGYALGYIPQINPIELIEIQYKADPEVKDGYITLTKLRTTIYLDDGTKKELKSSSLTTTSTNVITPTTSLTTTLLNLWLKIKCLFLRLIGKAC